VAAISACQAVLAICSGWDEAALQRKELAIDMHLLETLLNLQYHTTRRGNSDKRLLELLAQMQFVFWAHMQHYHARHHDTLVGSFAHMWQATARRRRAEKRLHIGSVQFDAIYNAISKDPEKNLRPYSHAMRMLQLLRVLLPTITAQPGITRVGCVVRALRAQKVIEQVQLLYEGKFADSQADYLLGKLSMGALILHVKAHMRKLEKAGRPPRRRSSAAKAGSSEAAGEYEEGSASGFGDNFMAMHLTDERSFVPHQSQPLAMHHLVASLAEAEESAPASAADAAPPKPKKTRRPSSRGSFSSPEGGAEAAELGLPGRRGPEQQLVHLLRRAARSAPGHVLLVSRPGGWQNGLHKGGSLLRGEP